MQNEETGNSQSESFDWVRIAACGSLIAGGILIISGKRRAGMAAAAAGTALALMDNQEDLRRFWMLLPGYIDQAQWLIGQVEEVVEDISNKGESLRSALGR